MLPELRDDGVGLLEALPYAFGESPFRIKGGAYRGHLLYCEEHVPGGNEAVSAAIGSGAAEFFSQPFLASSTYDVVPLARAGVACGSLTGRGYLPFVHHRTRAQAVLDVRGVYRFIARLVSDQALAVRVPRMMAQYMNFGHAQTRVEQPGLVIGTLAGIPLALAPWYATVAEAYISQAVESVGRARCAVSCRSLELDGEVHGLESAVLTFDIRVSANPS